MPRARQLSEMNNGTHGETVKVNGRNHVAVSVKNDSMGFTSSRSCWPAIVLVGCLGYTLSSAGNSARDLHTTAPCPLEVYTF